MVDGVLVVLPYSTAGEIGECVITYAVVDSLSVGATLTLRVCYHSQLPFRWQVSDSAERGYVSVSDLPRARLETCADADELRISIVDGEACPGDQITITLGEGAGFRVWAVRHDMAFVLLIDPPGRIHRFTMPVRAGGAEKLIVRNPSRVSPGQQVALFVRGVDRFGNTEEGFAGRLRIESAAPLEAPGEIICSEQHHGIARFAARVSGETRQSPVRVSVADPASGAGGVGNPMEIAPGSDPERIFWGDLHCHSSLAQALESPEFLYTYARDEEGLDLICHTEHDAGTEARWVGPRWRDWRPPVDSVADYVRATWEYRKDLVRKLHEPGEFVTLLGYEWASNLYGHMNVYYPTDEALIFYPDTIWQEDFTPRKVWKMLGETEAITVPHHPSHRIRSRPGGSVSGWDWAYYDEQRVPLVEIYSKHGNSEYFGCPRAVPDQVRDGCIAAALSRG